MTTCCSDSAETVSATGTITVALAGNPNSGKTTVFNGLTGLKQKVANYPGVTVEKKTGSCKLPDGSVANIVDLPGTYSLISRSPDELVAMEVLRGLRPDTPAPDVVVAVVDASNLQRNLYLITQLIELGRPLVVALNMMDVAASRGLAVSPERLQAQLGVPVIPVVGHKRQGIPELKAAILQARIAPLPDWSLPQAMKEEIMLVGGGLAILGDGGDGKNCGRREYLDHQIAIAERLLIGDHAADLKEIWLREPVSSLLAHSANRLSQLGIDPMQADIEAHYQWIEHVAAASQANSGSTDHATASHHNRAAAFSEKIDSILIHKIWGLAIFAVIMGTLFLSIFWLAQPIMDGVQWAINHGGLWAVHRLPDGPLKAMLTDGVIAGVGTVLAFVPQIALLFMFLAILEDSGYLARAAFLMDRLLSKVGLQGKSFIPLLSSFACAIPGIMATRTIENRRDRLATILIAPFMSCSARLPVYTLLIGVFFAQYGHLTQAGIMLGCYALGIIAAVITAFVFKRTFLKSAAASFILELPSYKMPQASQVARQVWQNAGKFVTRAGTTILCFSVILWALAYYPHLPRNRQQSLAASGADDNAIAAAQSEYSIAGRIGHGMEPAIRPLGYDWKMGVGLVSAFAAREVFVSTMGITYAVGNAEDGKTNDLQAAMVKDRYANGRPVWTPLVAISLLIWFVLAMQCVSTLAIVRRETGGWRWPIFMVVYMNVLAYVASLAVFQIGSMIWHQAV